MNEQTIERLSEGSFKITYANLQDFSLTIDFNPLINAFRLKGSYCLLHWQAKPVGERRFGVYDRKSDTYHAVMYHKLQINVNPSAIQVDELVIKTVPTAVLLFRNSIFNPEKFSIDRVFGGR